MNCGDSTRRRAQRQRRWRMRPLPSAHNNTMSCKCCCSICSCLFTHQADFFRISFCYFFLQQRTSQTAPGAPVVPLVQQIRRSVKVHALRADLASFSPQQANSRASAALRALTQLNSAQCSALNALPEQCSRRTASRAATTAPPAICRLSRVRPRVMRARRALTPPRTDPLRAPIAQPARSIRCLPHQFAHFVRRVDSASGLDRCSVQTVCRRPTPTPAAP